MNLELMSYIPDKKRGDRDTNKKQIRALVLETLSSYKRGEISEELFGLLTRAALEAEISDGLKKKIRVGKLKQLA